MISRLQAGLRWLFMHAEALFNRAFGDRLNPLYHLGATSFWLFWVVGVTGLYLFAFFDTGVAGAYQSVNDLTQRQWFAGGVMRSVHRYASGAMVATMLVHMLRHFAFDRLRGFRAFSWLTGVGLIWGVYAAGINGFMLPWDRLAQFVTVTSFEWLDWLPSFGGALIRNFIYPSSVSDRLFSLLVFIHIGVPLLVLLLMWVHVQRVPKAQTQPPRAIAVGTVAMLLALSLALPVTSQGGAADLATAVTTLELDWFLLPLFPLLERWPLGSVWALVSAGTALLVLLPWLRLRRRGAAPAGHRMTVHPGAIALPVRAGETLLEAGLRAGVALPYECRNGGCGVCLCTVLNGRVDHGAYQPAVLTGTMRAGGQALLCCATALEDVEVEVAGALLPAAAVRRLRARVVTMERLSDDVMRLMLALPAGERMRFSAGQYI
ncbi:MAG: 2Fe-2S iron-sulfur cluster-binding protein, partial [Alphaproteobacteria bacterium]|nr:2Fe-2S iron-sulfur cluster-binding protein [Alphaproteobacteria bacterium]